MTKEKLITCPICGKKLKYINNFHLKTHGYETEREFLVDYPNTQLKTKVVEQRIVKHLRELNSDSNLQTYKAKQGWTKARRLEKSIQMKKVSKELHTSAKYKKVREKIYKNRWGISVNYKCKDGTTLQCRSKIEARTAKLLEINNVEFKYEELFIPYTSSVDGKTHQYITDFYLPKLNLVIECKHSTDIGSVINEAKRQATLDKGYKYLYVDEKLSVCPNKFSKTLALYIEQSV